jgi:predicted dehydrogenase
MSLFLEKIGDADTLAGVKMKDIEMKLPVTPVKHNVTDELKAFFDTVLHGKANIIAGEEGAATIAVCEALIRSTETGKPETITYFA